jgi:hypothetical protein
LPAPLHAGITQAFNIDAAGQAPFDSCLDELRSKERQRERQVDLAHRASLAFRQVLSVNDGASYDFFEPAASAGDGAHETSPSLGTLGPNILSGYSVRQRDFSKSL